MKIHIENLIESLIGKHTNREIIDAIEGLRNDELFLNFLENNDFSFKSWEFYLMVNDIFLQLIDEQVESSLTLNLFDSSTLMFILLSMNGFSKAQQKKFRNVTFEILVNSHKFNLYKNTPKTIRKIVSKDKFIMEFFWLLPLFANNKIIVELINDWHIMVTDFNNANKINPELSIKIEEIISSNIKSNENVTRLKEIMEYL